MKPFYLRSMATCKLNHDQMEHQKKIEIQNTELQREKQITKNNSDRLLKLCDCLTSLGQDHDFNISRLTILCSELLSATCDLNKGSDDSTESSLCIAYQPDYCPTDEDKQISNLIRAAIGNEGTHKKISLTLIENQRLLVDTEAISKVGGWEYSIAQKKITYTPEVYRIYGVDLTFKMDDLVNPFKDYSDSDQQIIKQAINYVLENRKPYDLESHFKSFDGIQKWVRIKGHPVYAHGKIAKVSGNIVDITERKNAILALQESEARFHKLLDNVMNTAVQGYDANCIVRYWNKASEYVYGYTSEEAIGKNILDLIIPPSMRTAVMEDIGKMIESGIGRPAEELHLIRKDGSFVPVLSSHTIIQLPGKGKELFCIDIDLTDSIRLEKALIKSEAQFKELNAAKDKLFSIIAHDLRTPFNSILGFTDLLIVNIRKYDIEKIEKYLTYISLQAKSTYNLLENLLIWAKSKSNQLIFKPQYVYLPTCLNEIAESLQASATSKNIQLIIAHTPDIKIYVDLNILNTILRNLISNSIKYTNSGGLIEINVTKQPHDVEFKISDNGVGMSKETQKKLFRIDTNVSTIGTSNEKGTGLGLILCVEFIEKLNGKICVESELGKGSTFIFTLPA